MITTIMLTIIGLFFLSWLWSRRRFYMLYYRVGGPFGLPIIGNGMHFIDQTKIFSFMNKSCKDHGHTFCGFLGLQPCLVTADPVVIEEVLTNEHLIDKMEIYNALNDYAYEGLFSSPAKKWYNSRKHINKAFSNKLLLSFYPIFNNQIKIFCNVMDQFADKEEFDIYPFIAKLQLDTACSTTMGQETNFLTGGNQELLRAFYFIVEVVAQRIFNPLLTNKFLFNFSSLKKPYVRSKKIILSNTVDMINQKLEQFKNVSKDQGQDSSPEDDMNIIKCKAIFIDIMVREYLAGNFTWDELQAEVNTMILAAFETTTNVLYMSLMLLAMNPECQEKVYEEVMSVLSNDGDMTTVTAENVQNMVYMEMVMNEVMRLISPVPLVGRDATKDITLKDGTFIPRKTNVIINIFSLHRRKDIWGPDAATVFNPDNFLKDNLAKKHPYSFVPFTKGIRFCIGWRYAVISYKIMLAQIIRRYKIHTSVKFKDLIYCERIVLKFTNTPKIRLETRRKV